MSNLAEINNEFSNWCDQTLNMFGTLKCLNTHLISKGNDMTHKMCEWYEDGFIEIVESESNEKERILQLTHYMNVYREFNRL